MATLSINPTMLIPEQNALTQKTAPSMGQQSKATLNNRTVQLAITLTGAAALAALFSPMLSVTHTSNHTQALANKTTDQLNTMCFPRIFAAQQPHEDFGQNLTSSADKFKGALKRPVTALKAIKAIKATLPQCLLIKETAVAEYNPLSHLDITSIDRRQCVVISTKIEKETPKLPSLPGGEMVPALGLVFIVHVVARVAAAFFGIPL